MRAFNPNCVDPHEKLQDKEIPIRGMNIALSSCASFPVGVIDEELKGDLIDCRGRLILKLDNKTSCFASYDEAIAPENKNKESLISFPWSLKNLSIAYKHLPTSFFLYCVQLLLEDSAIAINTKNRVERTLKTDARQYWSPKRIKEVIINILPSSQKLGFALKCSVSLGLAVLFGLIYDKENGYWSGLTIAISFVQRRQATFWVANARGQGTAMGSIYGIICSFVVQKFGGVSFLPLIPWVVFSSFLMHSRMYGQAGGISAVIGTLLILGRQNYGPPTHFAIARIAEATIGLTCFIVVEIISNPSRGAGLAKAELSRSLRALQDCIDSIAITPSDKQVLSWSSTPELLEKQKKLKSIVCQLEEFVAEAELEPSFWFLPFHGACYRKMLESLSKMVDLLLFVAYSIENFSRLALKDGVKCVAMQDRVNENIKLFKTKVDPTLKCLEEITGMKSLRKLEKELKNKNLPCDIESGEYPNADTNRILGDNEETDSTTGSFLRHLEEMADEIHANRDEETLRGQMIVHYSCLGFCISCLIRETTKIENEVKELVMWENPSIHASPTEIYCKINALSSQ